MLKIMKVIKDHTCETLNNQHGTEVAVQKFDDGNWYWADYANNRNELNGIAYCPYCGKELRMEE